MYCTFAQSVLNVTATHRWHPKTPRKGVCKEGVTDSEVKIKDDVPIEVVVHPTSKTTATAAASAGMPRARTASSAIHGPGMKAYEQDPKLDAMRLLGEWIRRNRRPSSSRPALDRGR